MLKKIVGAFLPPLVVRVKDHVSSFLGSGRPAGASFRRSIILPHVSEGRAVVLIFDGMTNIGSPWLNEVFAHEDTKRYADRIRFQSSDYSRIYDQIATHFLKGHRPYTG